jgi:hypothetical protein
MAGYFIYSLDWNKFRQLVDRPTPSQLTTLAKLVRDGLEEEDDDSLDWPTDKKSLVELVSRRLALPDWYGDLSAAGKRVWEGVIFLACQDYKAIDVGFRVDGEGVYWDVIELAWKHLGVVPDRVSEVALSAFGTRPYRYHQPPRPGMSRADFDREQGERKASLDALGSVLGEFLESAKRGQASTDDLFEALDQNEGVSEEHKELIKSFINEDDDEDDEDDADADDWSPMHSMHTPDEVEKMRAELKSVESAILKSKSKDVRDQFQNDLMPAIEQIAADGRMLFIQVDT